MRETALYNAFRGVSFTEQKMAHSVVPYLRNTILSSSRFISVLNVII